MLSPKGSSEFPVGTKAGRDSGILEGALGHPRERVFSLQSVPSDSSASFLKTLGLESFLSVCQPHSAQPTEGLAKHCHVSGM